MNSLKVKVILLSERLWQTVALVMPLTAIHCMTCEPSMSNASERGCLGDGFFHGGRLNERFSDRLLMQRLHPVQMLCSARALSNALTLLV